MRLRLMVVYIIYDYQLAKRIYLSEGGSRRAQCRSIPLDYPNYWVCRVQLWSLARRKPKCNTRSLVWTLLHIYTRLWKLGFVGVTGCLSDASLALCIQRPPLAVFICPSRTAASRQTTYLTWELSRRPPKTVYNAKHTLWGEKWGKNSVRFFG